jgi:RNA polymerase sigma factor (sigma-70 family)
MLEQLSKDDKKWREMALCICGSKSLADDLTNDMYIKLHDSGKIYEEQKSIVNLVFTVIKNLYIDYLRKDKKNQKLFANTINEEIELAECKITAENRKTVNDALNELSFFDREILLHTHERSLRKNEKLLDITVRVLHHSKKIALQKLLETNNIKNYGS